MDHNEEDLIRKSQGGDKDAFACLYDIYGSRLLTYMVRYTGNRHKAEDLAVDAFMKAFIHIKQYSAKKGKFLTWLYTIATNIAKNEMRREKIWVFLQGMGSKKNDEGDSDIESSSVYADSRSENVVVDNDIRSYIEKAIASLPERDRQMFIMCVVDGMTYEEVASAHNTTVSSIHRSVEKAKMTLRGLLKEVRPKRGGR